MTWMADAPPQSRKEQWKRNECLVERRKPAEWHHRIGRRDQHHGPRNPWHESNPGASLPKPPPIRRQEVEFEQLADLWEAETALESVVSRKAMHRSYQQIIGMGTPALPMILTRLQSKPGQWFWALTAITGIDPALSEETVEGARVAWLRWGREHGLVGD